MNRFTAADVALVAGPADSSGWRVVTVPDGDGLRFDADGVLRASDGLPAADGVAYWLEGEIDAIRAGSNGQAPATVTASGVDLASGADLVPPGVDLSVAGANGKGDGAHIGPASGRGSAEYGANYRAIVKRREELAHMGPSPQLAASLRIVRDGLSGPKVSDDDIEAIMSGSVSPVSSNGSGPASGGLIVDSRVDFSGGMPALPAAAVIPDSAGVGACGWLDDFTKFARSASPRGYEGFYEAVGLWVLSTVAARRAAVRLGVKAFYPNLYLAFVAYTSLYAKSTTARVGADLLRAAGLGVLLGPDDATPQAFLSDMGGQLRQDYGSLLPEAQEAERGRLAFAGQRGWYFEEFGGKLDAMMRDGSVMADWRRALRVFDDNPDSYEYRTMTRRDSIASPYLALLGSLTPADLGRHAQAGASLWGDGFFARFAFVVPPADLRPGAGRFPQGLTSYPAGLIHPLQRWHERLGSPAVTVEERERAKGGPAVYAVERGPLPVTVYQLGPGVYDAFYSYHDALIGLAHEEAQYGAADVVGSYARFAEKAMRIAILLAGVSGYDAVDYVHWARAQSIAERWRADLHELINQLGRPARSEQAQLEEKVTAVIGRLGGFATAAEIARHIRGKSSAEIAELCDALARLEVLREAGTTRQGTKRYAQA